MGNSRRTEETLEGIANRLYREGATEGLPIVPPTEERVEEMYRGTDLPPDHELATPGGGEDVLTVEKLAINGVLAGCSPIQMPLLVAGARAMDDPSADLDGAAADPGSWGLQWVVNGPVRDEIDLRSDTGAFGPGFRSNRVIGRGLGFAYENTVGDPGEERERGGQGTPFKHSAVAGENEERSPWEPYHVTHGFDEEESTITLSTRRSFVQFIPNQMGAEGTLQAMQYNTPPQMVGERSDSGERRVVHTMGPYNAEELADAGLSKQDVKAYLCENSVLPYDKVGPELSDRPDGAAGSSGVPPLQARQIADPDLVEVFVVGGSGRFNAVGHSMGGSVTVPIEFPDGWKRLVEEYLVERDWGEISYGDG